MLFLNEIDRDLFAIEVGKPFSEITEEDETVFVKKRKRSVDLLKDFTSSQHAKRGWKFKEKMKWALKKFHHSPEGKRLHRKLARFNATRDFKPRSSLEDARKELKKEMTEELKFFLPLSHHFIIEYLLDSIDEQLS